MRFFVKFILILNLGPFNSSGICRVKDDKIYLEFRLSPFGIWMKFRSQVETPENSHQMREANQMREFVQDIIMRSELNP